MKYIVAAFFLLITIVNIGQSKLDKLLAYEDSLVKILEEMRVATSLKIKFEINNKFEQKLRMLLSLDESFMHDFNELNKKMSTLRAPDNSFRIFNWNMEVPNTEEQYFFCLIMKYDKRKEEYITIELFDKSKYETREPELNVYSDKKWLGALYYKIIPVQKGSKTIYTLLGWDGNNRMSNKKIIETMAFQGSDGVKFGFPVFKVDDDKSKRRIIFQYKKQSSMSLKHEFKKKKDILIFDHLSPTSPQLEGMYDFYVPDGSFDGFIWENGKWNYQKDVDARTGKSKTDKLYNKPE